MFPNTINTLWNLYYNNDDYEPLTHNSILSNFKKFEFLDMPIHSIGTEKILSKYVLFSDLNNPEVILIYVFSGLI